MIYSFRNQVPSQSLRWKLTITPSTVMMAMVTMKGLRLLRIAMTYYWKKDETLTAGIDTNSD